MSCVVLSLINSIHDDIVKKFKETFSYFQVPLCDATTPLIVGGDLAKPGEFPSMAALGYSDDFSSEIKWRCGGTCKSSPISITFFTETTL